MSNSLKGQNPSIMEQQRQPARLNNDNLVQFRIKPEQLALFRRLADYLCQNGFIQEPSLSRIAHMCMMMIGQKFERQEAENLERLVTKRLADARAKVNPRFRDEQYFYSHGQQPSPPPAAVVAAPQIQTPQRPVAANVL